MRGIAYCTLAGIVALGSIGAWAQGSGAAAGEAAVVKRAAELREQPGETSRSLGALAVQTPVTRLPERRGAWVQVRTAQGASGWLHIFDITSAAAPGGGGGNTAAGALRGLTGFFGRNTGAGSSQVASTSTVGIRGLSAEDLANSQPNPQAVQQAEGLRQDASQAQAFAAAASLQPRPLLVLPEPPRPASPGTASQATPTTE